MKRLVVSLLAMVCVLVLSAQSIYDFKVKDDAGKNVSLSEYKGKVLLIVNTATRCGFTPQYKELEALYEKYHAKGFEILDFPCNQFGAQAPGSIREIHQFCTANFDIQFPQFDKIDVNGANAHPLFTWLKAQKGFGGFDLNDQIGKMLDDMLRKRDADFDKKSDIKWNFTKFLVSRDGKVVKRYEPTAKMSDVESDILYQLAAKTQRMDALSQLKAEPRKAYGNDCPYLFESYPMTETPQGYTPFYISLYARHGSRYNWSEKLYLDLDTLLTVAHDKKLLTPEGEAFCQKFMAAKQELMTGVGELTQLGWDQHQRIARIMYDEFTDVFRKGGNVLAVSSLSHRCILSMSAFCQELVQCNPLIEIREQSSRFTLDAVVPTDRQNPVKHHFPKPVKPRYEKNRAMFKSDNSLPEKVLARTFASTEGLPYKAHKAAYLLIDFYKTLPSINYEGMMGQLLNDDEIAAQWEASNLGSYSWVFSAQYDVMPILQDIIKKADAVLDGTSDHIADLRFGHDSFMGPLTVVLGINGADKDPEDPYEVKNCYQNWETCKACNVQLVFYRGQKEKEDILVKCLLNGNEVSLPVPTTQAPYYKWSDFRAFYLKRCLLDGFK